MASFEGPKKPPYKDLLKQINMLDVARLMCRRTKGSKLKVVFLDIAIIAVVPSF